MGKLTINGPCSIAMLVYERVPVNATKYHSASHACWLCLKNRLPQASNGSNQCHPHMFTIWLWLTVRHGKSPFLLGEPSISMGHLYHGYVSHNQMVNGHYIALPCYSPRLSDLSDTPAETAAPRCGLRIATHLAVKVAVHHMGEESSAPVGRARSALVMNE